MKKRIIFFSLVVGFSSFATNVFLNSISLSANHAFVDFLLPSLFAGDTLPDVIQNTLPATGTILVYDHTGTRISYGSGFFISRNGDFITNRHVIEGVDHAEIKSYDGKIYSVLRIIGDDKKSDLVRLQTDAPGDEVAYLSLSSSNPALGERVIVVGSPMGFTGTITEGIISAFRDHPKLGEILQTTAAIYPGSSGSPVINMKGEVIGVATFRIHNGRYLNFAIPCKKVRTIHLFVPILLTEWEKERQREWRGSAEGLMETGMEFLQQNDFQKARGYFKKAIRKNPNFARAYVQLGYCEKKLGHLDEALKAYRQAIAKNQHLAIAYFHLGTLYCEQGNSGEAIAAFQQAIRINPVYPEAYCNLGTAYYNNGQYDEAIVALKKAVRCKPDYADAYYNLGLAAGMMGDYKGAIKYFRLSTLLDPGNKEGYCNLYTIFAHLGRYMEAYEIYEQLNQIDPEFTRRYIDAKELIRELKQKAAQFTRSDNDLAISLAKKNQN